MKIKVFLFVVCVWAFACTPKQEAKTSSRILIEAIGVINNDSTAPPVITFIDKTNAPKTIPAGKPVVRLNPNSDGLGASNFTNYNTEQGLALSSVHCEYRDKKGNLWFGTEGGGVSQYDGKSFTNFTVANGLANNVVVCITEDKTGNLWFGTGEGVSRYDGKSFTNFTTAQGLINNIVSSIMEDTTGNLWFGTIGGVSRYDRKSFTPFTTAEGLANDNVRSITLDKKGNLWFGTIGGVSRYDGKSFNNFTIMHGLANNVVNSILKDRTGDLWFGTIGGVSYYKDNSFTNFTTAKGLVHNDVLTITEDKTGDLWFGTSEGVSRYDGTSFTNFTTAQGLIHNFVISITEDKTGNPWLSTYGSGVSRYDGKSFTNFTKTQGLAEYDVYSFAEDTAGNLWFGTGAGLSRYNGSSFANFTTAQGLVGNFISEIIKDQKGYLWIGTNRGVSRYNGHSFTNFTTAQGLANNSVSCILKDKTGELWFGTNGGVSCYNGSSFTSFTTAQGLINNNVTSIAEDNTGKLWFGTAGGVSRYDGTSFTNFTTAQGLAKNDVLNITKDQKGNLWFSTFGGGVSRYDGRSFINFTTTQGLADNNVWAIVVDLQGNIFMGTNLGFSVLKEFKSHSPGPSSNGKIIAAVNSLNNEELKNYQPVFEIYNEKTGYPVKDMIPNPMFVDSKGIIWAGFSDKLVRFDYNAIHKNTEPPAVFIQAVKIQEENISWNNLIKKGKTDPEVDSLVILNEEVLTFGRELSGSERNSMRSKFSGITFDSITPFYPVPQNLVLPYSDNSISFDFVAIEPARNFMVRYQYILEGYDNDWGPVTDKTSATFGNIQEGVYTFKLKARSPDGVWSEPITYTFEVLPPWHRTWWAYLLYAILFIGAIWVFIHYRSRSLRREKRLLEEKVTQRTTQLSRSLEELKQAQAQLIQSEKMASLGELTAGIAHEIQNPLNFVNNFSEVNKELLGEMKDEIEKGNIEEVKAIANNIINNEEKIGQHGKRADAIVKGMLQHSRTSSGQKEPTDINALADEYLRLAYHGLRAKDKSFQAKFESDFDNGIGKLNIISQDIGRVILNLINNAFYAVTEKKKQMGEGYEPIVSVSTKKANGMVEIRIKDNGNGIPQKILDKIFQPFFTTKPAGQGTGLGLSLAYDIVKVHGGELKVETKEGEGSVFIISLPAL